VMEIEPYKRLAHIPTGNDRFTQLPTGYPTVPWLAVTAIGFLTLAASVSCPLQLSRYAQLSSLPSWGNMTTYI
jgi:hypothetical protein